MCRYEVKFAAEPVIHSNAIPARHITIPLTGSLTIRGILYLFHSDISQLYITFVHFVGVSLITAAENFRNALTALTVELVFIVDNMRTAERKSVIGIKMF